MKSTALFGLALVGALSVQPAAAVTADGSGVQQGGISINGVEDGQDLVVSFDWDDTPVEGWLNFTSSTLFDIVFESFVAASLGSADRTALILQRLNGPAGGSGDQSVVSDTISAIGAPSGSVGAAAQVFSGLERTLITGQGGQTDALKPDAAGALFSDLSAGSYRIGVFDSSTPEDATATFRITPIPLPAGAFGLLAALGLAGVVRRRAA